MLIFISQVMRNKTYEQIQQERKELVEVLESKGHRVYDSVHKEAPKNEDEALKQTIQSLQQLSECDAIFLMDNWQSGRCCRFEHDLALSYGIKIFKSLDEVPNAQRENTDVDTKSFDSVLKYAESLIKDVQYKHFETTTVTVCCITCKNGYSIVGDSSCVNKDIFDTELGKKYAYEDALNKLTKVIAFNLV